MFGLPSGWFCVCDKLYYLTLKIKQFSYQLEKKHSYYPPTTVKHYVCKGILQKLYNNLPPYWYENFVSYDLTFQIGRSVHLYAPVNILPVRGGGRRADPGEFDILKYLESKSPP